MRESFLLGAREGRLTKSASTGTLILFRTAELAKQALKESPLEYGVVLVTNPDEVGFFQDSAVEECLTPIGKALRVDPACIGDMQ